ncbi:MAG: hypothetical protein M5U28_40925 [Sandaracinaceae bacterium]|nr:hypothetical protein [Sandaracinaceae bacterium]
MKAFVFFSVHEPMFDGIVRRLFTRRVLGSAGGFVWGLQQAEVVERAGRLYEPLIIFSRDVLPLAEGAPDIGYLQSCERRYGFS